MNKAQNVLDYYMMCNKLKNVLRTGWLNWNIKKERLESVAEHIFGVQMLAIAMYSEYQYDIDIKKAIQMIALHELEEIIIGDLTLFDISKEDKEHIGHDAVDQVVKSLKIKDDIKNLIFEFDERKTKEAIFAYYCDKLEADLQAKLYDEEGYIDLNNQLNNKAMQDENVQKFLKEGKSFSEMWISFGQERYGYDENFMEVSNYALNHKFSSK